MSESAALLAAIIANPDEDTPRLVYADWLEENGGDRYAAHIRAEIKAFRGWKDYDAANAVELFFSVRGFDGLKRIDWAKIDGPLAARVAAERADRKRKGFPLSPKRADLPRVHGVDYQLDGRGFYGNVNVHDTVAFLEQADAIFRAAPITTVDFYDYFSEEEARELIAKGCLARIRDLTFTGAFDPDAVRVLGRHCDAAGVRSLDITEPFDGAGVVNSLADGLHWTGLETLNCDFFDEASPPGRGQMADLFARRQFRNLRDLSAIDSKLDDDAVRTIAKKLPGLRRLNIGSNRITGDGARALAESRSLTRLESLDLGSCRVADGAALAAIVNSPKLPALSVLVLEDNPCRGPIEKELAKPGRGPGLRVLELESSNLNASAYEALGRCPAVRGLWYLSLRSAGVTDSALEKLLSAAAFERLAFLNLSFNSLTERGARALAGWPGATSLQWLDLGNNPLGNGGAKALAASTHLGGLKELMFAGRGAAVLKKRFKKAME